MYCYLWVIDTIIDENQAVLVKLINWYSLKYNQIFFSVVYSPLKSNHY